MYASLTQVGEQVGYLLPGSLPRTIGLTLSWCNSCGEWILENQQEWGDTHSSLHTSSTTQVWW